MPRTKRLNRRGESFYHITSRIVDQVRRFTPEENTRNVELLRRVEKFSAVQVLSYCFMGNHFHLLVRIPEPQPVSETQLRERIEALYGSDYLKELLQRWANFGDDLGTVEREKESYRKRMYSLHEFVKTLKQRLTQSYNKRHNRKGTLWEERYHSILLEPTARVLSAVAAYIDLNPIRAGMVSDPKDYLFSSYGEACAGGTLARAGICRLYQSNKKLPKWKDIASEYRQRLVLKANPSKAKKRSGMRRKDIRDILENKGKLSISQILGCKIRYFSSGLALGSSSFVQDIRDWFSQSQKRRC